VGNGTRSGLRQNRAPSTGVTVVQYDVAGGDAFGTSAAAIVGHTLAAARYGSIIVMHVTLANAPLTPSHYPESSPACAPAESPW
jgi:hypothetical protein